MSGGDINFDNFTDAEREMILSVLNRNDQIRRREEKRLKNMKKEITDLRHRSAIKQGEDPSSMCARCHAPLGPVWQSGETCPSCKHKVCNLCREPDPRSSSGWICSLCAKKLDFKLKSAPYRICNASVPDQIKACLEGDSEYLDETSDRLHRLAPIPNSNLTNIHFDRNNKNSSIFGSISSLGSVGSNRSESMAKMLRKIQLAQKSGDSYRTPSTMSVSSYEIPRYRSSKIDTAEVSDVEDLTYRQIDALNRTSPDKKGNVAFDERGTPPKITVAGATSASPLVNEVNHKHFSRKPQHLAKRFHDNHQEHLRSSSSSLTSSTPNLTRQLHDDDGESQHQSAYIRRRHQPHDSNHLHVNDDNVSHQQRMRRHYQSAGKVLNKSMPDLVANQDPIKLKRNNFSAGNSTTFDYLDQDCSSHFQDVSDDDEDVHLPNASFSKKVAARERLKFSLSNTRQVIRNHNRPASATYDSGFQNNIENSPRRDKKSISESNLHHPDEWDFEESKSERWWKNPMCETIIVPKRSPYQKPMVNVQETIKENSIQDSFSSNRSTDSFGFLYQHYADQLKGVKSYSSTSSRSSKLGSEGSKDTTSSSTSRRRLPALPLQREQNTTPSVLDEFTFLSDVSVASSVIPNNSNSTVDAPTKHIEDSAEIITISPLPEGENQSYNDDASTLSNTSVPSLPYDSNQGTTSSNVGSTTVTPDVSDWPSSNGDMFVKSNVLMNPPNINSKILKKKNHRYQKAAEMAGSDLVVQQQPAKMLMNNLPEYPKPNHILSHSKSMDEENYNQPLADNNEKQADLKLRSLTTPNNHQDKPNSSPYLYQKRKARNFERKSIQPPDDQIDNSTFIKTRSFETIEINDHDDEEKSPETISKVIEYSPSKSETLPKQFTFTEDLYTKPQKKQLNRKQKRDNTGNNFDESEVGKNRFSTFARNIINFSPASTLQKQKRIQKKKQLQSGSNKTLESKKNPDRILAQDDIYKSMPDITMSESADSILSPHSTPETPIKRFGSLLSLRSNNSKIKRKKQYDRKYPYMKRQNDPVQHRPYQWGSDDKSDGVKFLSYRRCCDTYIVPPEENVKRKLNYLSTYSESNDTPLSPSITSDFGSFQRGGLSSLYRPQASSSLDDANEISTSEVTSQNTNNDNTLPHGKATRPNIETLYKKYNLISSEGNDKKETKPESEQAMTDSSSPSDGCPISRDAENAREFYDDNFVNYTSDRDDKNAQSNRRSNMPAYFRSTGNHSLSDKLSFCSDYSTMTSRASTSASLYSETVPMANLPPITGEILLSIQYDHGLQILQIRIIQCRNLAIGDPDRQTSDSYVKTYLLPDKMRKSKHKTKVVRRTLNPIFKDVIKYQIARKDLVTRYLAVAVWHHDRVGRNVFLGEVIFSLADENFFDDPRWFDLRDKQIGWKVDVRTGNAFLIVDWDQSDINLYHLDWGRDRIQRKGMHVVPSKLPSAVFSKGELILRLKFATGNPIDYSQRKNALNSSHNPSLGELEVNVVGARNLTGVRTNGLSDPFCKLYLLPEPKFRQTKEKTAVIKQTVNPEWDTTICYEDLSIDDLQERCLEITIWDYDRFGTNEFLGGVRLNRGTGISYGTKTDYIDAREEESKCWLEMLKRKNQWVECTLKLRPNMIKLEPIFET